MPARYRVLDVMSSSSVGATFRVIDSGLRQAPAVIKVQALPQPHGAEAAKQAFLEHCRLLADISSLHVASPYTFGVAAGASGKPYGYTVREFVNGVALSELTRPLSPESVIRSVVDICSGLDSLHQRGLRHHDLKPENVVVQRTRAGVIDDLSQCVLIDLSYRAQSRRGLGEVTLQYVAPELLAGEPGDARADLYALGVLAYVSLAGAYPFAGASVAEIIRLQRTKRFRPLADLCTATSGLVRTVEQLLDPFPENRPESVQDLLAALSECDEFSIVSSRSTQLAQSVRSLIGRGEELDECLQQLGRPSAASGAGCIEVRAPHGCGVTHFLRELQDRVEVAGSAVLTALPQLSSGGSIISQLAGPVAGLARQTDESEPRPEEKATASASDVLDDLLVASGSKRIVFFVDDWRECTDSELAFLQRILLQDQVARSEPRHSGGRAQVVLGGRIRGTKSQTPQSQALEALIDVHVNLKPWREDHVSRAETLLGGNRPLPGAARKIIVELSGGRPSSALELLDVAMQTHAAGADVCAALQAQEESLVSTAPSEPPQNAGPALALAVWGEAMPAGDWCQLTRLVAGRTPVEDSRYVEVRDDGWVAPTPDAQMLLRGVNGQLADSLSKAVESVASRLWRSTKTEDLLRVLRFTSRWRHVGVELRWSVRRALLLLLRRGNFVETNSLASVLASRSPAEADWLELIADAARVEAGDARAHPSDGTSDWACLRFYRRWCLSRALQRSRFKRDALQVLDELRDNAGVDGQRSHVSLISDHAILAAELGQHEDARRGQRSLLEATARLDALKLRHPDALRAAQEAEDPRLSRRIYALSRYYRVRQRVHWAAGRYLAAARCSRSERALHVAVGDSVGEAACLNNEGIALSRAGQPEAALGVFRACCALRERSDDERGLVVVLNNTASAFTGLGQTSHAAAALNRARVLAARNGLTRHAHMAMLHLGIAYARNGQLVDARRTFGRLIRTSLEGGHRDSAARATINFAHMALDLWHIAIAERFLERARALVSGNPALSRALLALEAELSLLVEDSDRLRRALSRAQSEQDESLQFVEYEWALNAEACLEPLRRAALTRDQRLRRVLMRVRTRKSIVTANSLSRLLALCKGNSARMALDWVIEHFSAEEVINEQSLRIAWDVMSRPDLAEGHDDCQIRLRALVSWHLRRQGRALESQGLLQDALHRYRRLEKKLGRANTGDAVLDKLYLLLRRALGAGASSLNARPQRSDALQARAFRTRGMDRSAPVARSNHDLLRSLGEAIASTDDTDRVLGRLLELALKSTGAQRAVLVISDGSEIEVRGQAFAPGVEAHEELSWAIVTHVLASGHPEVYRDALAAEQLASHRSVETLSLRSVACVPLQTVGGAAGALYLDHQGIAGLFNDEELALLTLIANVVAVTLASGRLAQVAEASEAQLEEAHEQLVRSERNRLAGQVATGMAHDLKNVLSTIVARCQLVRGAETSDSVLRSVRGMENAAQSAATMIEKLQECSREHSLQHDEIVDVSVIAQEAIDLLSPRYAGGVEVEARLTKGCLAKVVPGELRELFLNLIVNACDAMPEGGRLSVTVRPDESGVLVDVEDSGAGMPPDVRDRVFEPFFTTKGKKGTGLGLAIVKNVVLKNKGTIAIESEAGSGTVVSVALPAVPVARSRPASTEGLS